jgi:CheY-like chemotaxis protein
MQPLVHESAATTLASAIPQSALCTPQSLILIIDNDPDTRDMLRRRLEKDGLTVVDAAHGRAGLEQTAQAMPALIILDLLMPIMDGFAFLEEFRRQPGAGGVPIIVVTVKDLTDEDHRQLDTTVTRIFQKGAISADNLMHELRALLPIQT